ncbi:MFS transporter [Candidatus Woesearchaeota archaeon]|nr:MFS transporter [Candidatus Woesearchaeota archaeon]
MELRQIFTIQKLYTSFEILSFCLLYVYLIQYFSPLQIISAAALGYSIPAALIFFSRFLDTKRFMIFGLSARWIALLIFLLPPRPVFLYIFYALFGIFIFFFWTSYNIRYFHFSHSMNRATSAGHYIIVGAFLSTFVPIISGLFVDNLGFRSLTILGSLMMLFIIFKASRIDEFLVSYDFREAFRKSKGIRSLKFLQGAWEIIYISVSIHTLTFISESMSYALYLSFIGFISIIATFIVTRISDKDNKRMKFFFPLLIFLIAAMINLFFADSVEKWLIATALLGFLQTLIYPFFLAVVLDKVEDKSTSLIIREFMLGLGRAFSASVLVVMLFFGFPFPLFFIFTSLIMLAYLALLIIKGVYFEEAYYPLSPVVKLYNGSKKLVANIYPWGQVQKLSSFPKRFFLHFYNGSRWVRSKSISRSTENSIIKGRTSGLFGKER